MGELGKFDDPRKGGFLQSILLTLKTASNGRLE